MIQFVREGEKFKITDNSNTTNVDGISHDLTDYVINNGEWFNLRIEYYRGDGNSVRFKVYLNGECVAISDNFYGSEKSGAAVNSRVESIYFYSLMSTTGTLYFDNVSLGGFNGSCKDSVTVN